MTPKEYAGWLADKIPAYGDFGKEAALVLIRQANEIERLRIGHDRYETARLMNPRMWSVAWEINVNTGKPFDEIIDNMRPFFMGDK